MNSDPDYFECVVLLEHSSGLCNKTVSSLFSNKCKSLTPPSVQKVLLPLNGKSAACSRSKVYYQECLMI